MLNIKVDFYAINWIQIVHYNKYKLFELTNSKVLEIIFMFFEFIILRKDGKSMDVFLKLMSIIKLCFHYEE